MESHSHHKNHRRFYILMTTVIVGALLILMFINDKGSFSMTGSSIGFEDNFEEETTKDSETTSRSKGDIDLVLNYDSIPEINEEKTSLKTIKISFKDMDTKIKINEEEVELRGLETSNIEINNFKGGLNFDEISLSLNGAGDKITINGMTISTKRAMEISFSGLVYETLELTEVGINSIYLEDGNGKVIVNEKMEYVLDYDEKIKLNNFYGDFSAGLSNQSEVILEGIVSSLSVDGDLNLNLG